MIKNQKYIIKRDRFKIKMFVKKLNTNEQKNPL